MAERGGAGGEWGGWKGPRCAAGTAGWLLGSPSRKAATSGRSAVNVGAALAARGQLEYNVGGGSGSELGHCVDWGKGEILGPEKWDGWRADCRYGDWRVVGLCSR